VDWEKAKRAGYKPVKSAYVFLDSKRVQKDVGVRPDVLSSREG